MLVFQFYFLVFYHFPEKENININLGHSGRITHIPVDIFPTSIHYKTKGCHGGWMKTEILTIQRCESALGPRSETTADHIELANLPIAFEWCLKINNSLYAIFSTGFASLISFNYFILTKSTKEVVILPFCLTSWRDWLLAWIFWQTEFYSLVNSLAFKLSGTWQRISIYWSEACLEPLLSAQYLSTPQELHCRALLPLSHSESSGVCKIGARLVQELHILVQYY